MKAIADVLHDEGIYGEQVSRSQAQGIADDAGQKIGSHMQTIDDAIASDATLQTKGLGVVSCCHETCSSLLERGDLGA